MKKTCVLSLLVLLLFGGGRVFAQKVAVKTNVLYWATTTPNLGVEFGLGKKTSLELFGGYNPWTLNKERNKKVKHYLIQPEFRYWLCERFQGHFFGVHAGFAEYNIGGVRVPLLPSHVKNNRYEGWAVLGGISYGYVWILGRRLNLEATIGAGYVFWDYDRYDCVKCGDYHGGNTKGRFNLTKAGITLVYLIK
ncbi:MULTISPECIES: DUF3575 domain-containing protein [Odoribacteraceae]|uniref:DUF3575 domain-containing protein n=1 Tax=Odoribacteraceae TaxID=1853231 RepID=UPI000E549142|nr:MULTISPECIES: DUF3575 domain-containing protein [Odoribacteraceae]MCQ4875482.1 DUF3575 domain-containing protein [Butyricimonas paravirosa]RHR80328.1 DUF3575 domain-containing protein [Odoribacter sp. AF15-53]